MTVKQQFMYGTKKMRIDDPARPPFGALPGLLQDGVAVAVVPHLVLYPCLGAMEKVSIHANVLVGPALSRQFHWIVPATELVFFWSAWLEDPEAELIKAGWHYQGARMNDARPKVSKVIAAEDLMKELGL